MIRYIIKILVIIIAITFAIFASPFAKGDHVGWIETKAQIHMTSNNLKNFKTDNTVLKLLLEETIKSDNKTFEGLFEKDKSTFLLFEISYEASVESENKPALQNINIIQHGFFKALDPSLQKKLHGKDDLVINIRYKSDNPIFIQFSVDNTWVEAPMLLTETIDKKWIPSKKTRQLLP
ncbi:MAG: hypothetical protein ACRYE9_05415 [Janthinobacterium lividum]